MAVMDKAEKIRLEIAELKKKTNYALELVGLDHLASRFATKLSGGQRQRVALDISK